MWKRGEQFLLFSTLFYMYISNLRSQITYSFVKCDCSIDCFPHSLNSDMSWYGYLCFSELFGIRDNESPFCINVPLVILYQDCSSHLDSSKNLAARGAGLIFPIYLYRKLYKNIPVRNHWTDFDIILQKCSFGDPLPRLFKPFGFVKKRGHPGAGLIFPIYL